MSNLAIDQIIDTPDYEAIKIKQQATWDSGDYGRIGVILQKTGEDVCESMDLRAGQTVLDVAAGNGNATTAAARRFTKVVSTDYVPDLLEQSRIRTDAEGFPVDYQQADAEDLPFAENRFDNVVSTFGVMFTPNQEKTASELIRVCRPGGKIGLVNWTPNGFIGRLFKIIGQYVNPPAGLKSPALWGTPEFVEANFGGCADIQNETKHFVFRFQSPEHWLDVFRTYYGPLLKAFEAQSEENAEKLEAEVLALIGEMNVADDGTMVLPSEYLETVITK